MNVYNIIFLSRTQLRHLEIIFNFLQHLLFIGYHSYWTTHVLLSENLTIP